MLLHLYSYSSIKFIIHEKKVMYMVVGDLNKPAIAKNATKGYAKAVYCQCQCTKPVVVRVERGIVDN